MQITDKNVFKELKKVNCYHLEYSLELYPEDERGDRNDMQMLADETSYILSNYAEDGHIYNDELKRARRILKRTKNGKVFPLDVETFKPRIAKRDIDNAREVINEYKRLKSLMNRLNKQGYFGKW